MKKTLPNLFIAVCTLSGLTAEADDISGRIEFLSPKESTIQLENHAVPFHVQANDSSVTDDLRNLMSGDFIFGEGEIQADSEKIILHSIDSVGIKKLLRIWIDTSGNQFEFWSFDCIYTKDKANSKITKWTYGLTPIARNQWDIQMEHEGHVKFGTVTHTHLLTDDALEIEFIDPDTGNTSIVLNLKPLGAKADDK